MLFLKRYLKLGKIKSTIKMMGDYQAMKEDHKSLCLVFESEAYYEECIKDRDKFKIFLIREYEKYPELFPKDFKEGWKLNGFTEVSKKMEIIMRRIELGSGVYQVRPSFVMPYMIVKTDEVSKGLDMHRSGTSFEGVPRILGRNEMYWYRAFCSLGRYSIIGTTIKNPENIPVNLVADEKHTKWMGEKVYLTSTVAEGCILGSSLSSNADESGLIRAYG